MNDTDHNGDGDIDKDDDEWDGIGPGIELLGVEFDGSTLPVNSKVRLSCSDPSVVRIFVPGISTGIIGPGTASNSWTRTAATPQDPYIQNMMDGYFAAGANPFKVEGVSPGHSDITIELEDPDGNLVYSDKVTVSVVEVDVDVDTDNDGTIDSDDTGEDEFEQYEPGVIVCVDRHGDGSNLDHLVEMKLMLLPTNLSSGTLTLEASTNGSYVKIWTNSAKTTEVTLPETYTLSTDTIPSLLWIDGVSTGKVVLDLYYKDSGGTEICRDKVAVFVTETVSWSPSGTNAYSWEPCSWPLGTPGRINPKAVDAALDRIKDHGWNIAVARYSDTTANDDDIEECTLSNFKALEDGGILIVDGHGVDVGAYGEISGAYRTTEPQATNWIAGESDMTARQSSYWGWYSSVSPAWLSANWKTPRDTNNAIAVIYNCHGAEGGQASSAVGSAGGRVMFGYTDARNPTEHENDAERLFGRMNGSLDSAKRRTAGEAYESGTGYTATFTLYGNEWTTLNPSPNHAFPSSSVRNRKGSGCIVMDTYMDSTISANDAVTVTSGSVSARR